MGGGGGLIRDLNSSWGGCIHTYRGTLSLKQSVFKPEYLPSTWELLIGKDLRIGSLEVEINAKEILLNLVLSVIVFVLLPNLHFPMGINVEDCIWTLEFKF